MAKILYSNKATEDLLEIWNYTYDTWSETQADKYFEEIIEKCNELASNYDEEKDYSLLFENLKGVKCNRHIIFFRKLANQNIEITRILHEKMDLGKHIK